MQSPQDQLARADRLQAAIAALQQEIKLIEATGEVAPPHKCMFFIIRC
jgi:hypothetical protein